MYLRHSRALIIVIFILAFSCKQKEMIFPKDDTVSVWQRRYGANDIDFGISICPAKRGGYVVAGYTYSYGAGEDDVYLLKIDENGYAPPIEGKVNVSRGGNILDDIYPKNLRTSDHNFIIPRSRLKDR